MEERQGGAARFAIWPLPQRDSLRSRPICAIVMVVKVGAREAVLCLLRSLGCRGGPGATQEACSCSEESVCAVVTEHSRQGRGCPALA